MPSVAVVVPDTTLRAVFDIATHSLDFNSGFLDDDEVKHLRALAVILEVDPMVATPATFRCKYDPPHEYGDWHDTYGWPPNARARVCQRCDHIEYDPPDAPERARIANATSVAHTLPVATGGIQR